MEAAGKTSVFAHRILLPDADAGYLAVPENEDGFTVIHLDGKDYTALLFPIQSNQRVMRHADRQALCQPCFLWTRGEIERFLSSYEVFEEFEFVDICENPSAEAERIDMNPFIKTHSFLQKKRKMAVILHAKDGADIFRYEKMFFLVSELQLCTEEYEWTGILK